MSEKKYHALVDGHIFIGGVDDIKEMMENEKVDLVLDLREDNSEKEFDYPRVHSPIIEEKLGQDESVKSAVNQVLNAYKEGKKVYFHCSGGRNRTGTVAITTLLSLGKAKTVEEAEQKVKAVRPQVNVKPELKEVLNRLYR